MAKLTTRDIISIELDYIDRSSILDRDIGIKVHFYNYFTPGLAVLVSLDDNTEYLTNQGRRKYVILKGSYPKKWMNNKTQNNLLKLGILGIVEENGNKVLKFIKDSHPLTTGDVMTALTVSANPSPKPNYFLEDKRLCSNRVYLNSVEHSQESDQSQQSLLADGFSEDGFNIILDKLMQNLIQDNSPLMTKLVDKTLDAQYKRNLKYKFKPYSTEEIKNQTFNIYNENLINEALKILGEDHKLLIVGESGSGKSRLATLLAQQLTGKIIDSESVDGRYQHIWIKNVDGEMLWYTGQDSTLFGNLNIFINHINNEVKENPSNVNQKYVFILNEIQRTDLGAISGNLFESWSSGVMPDDIPKNLYIICTACSNSDFELDEQIFQRFGHIELNYLRKENPDMIFRLCKAIAENSIFESRFEECSDIISKCQELNDIEDYQVINMRHLFAMLNNRVIKNPINKEDLTSPGKKKLQEMINKGYYKT